MIMSKRARIKVPNRLGFPGQSLDDLWPSLQDAIDHIYDGQVEELSFERLYRTVYSLVVIKKGPQLYGKLQSYLTEKLESLRKDEFSDANRGFEILEKIVEVWDSQCTCFKLIGDLMIYLDKVYCKPERHLEIYDLCLNIFKGSVLNPLAQIINEALLDEINRGRSSMIVDKSHTKIWKHVIDMMETLSDENDNFFLTHFEPLFIENTEHYYKDAINSREMSPNEYLKFMQEYKAFEMTNDELFLNSDTISKVITSFDKVLLWNEKFTSIVPLVIHQAICEADIQLLNDISNLSTEHEYVLKIVQCIQNCLTNDANAISIDPTSKKKTQIAVEWTTSVLKLSKKYQQIIDNIKWPSSFTDVDTKDGVQKKAHIVENVLSEFLNKNCKRSIESITLYLDSCFKITKDKEEEREVMQNLAEAVKLFNLPAEKDFFEMMYKQQLSKRLLQGRSMIELEKWVLQRIKDEVGTFFTSRLYGMLKDVSTSQELAKSFYATKPEVEILEKSEFNPQILTGINWPFKSFDSSDSNFNIPSKLENLKVDFMSFYSKQYPERTLKWAYHLCRLEIGFQFDQSYHDISMSMFAASIFLLFEEHDELSTEMIGLLTQLPEQELHRQLLSLSIVPKTRILKKKPLSKSINPEDKFSINYSFTAPTKGVKVQTIVSVSSSKGELASKSTQETLEQRRVTETNAAITRIMKSKRNLSHYRLSELTIEAVKVRFNLSTSTFKKSINYLLEKEYIQRDPDDATIYHYLP